MADVAHLVEVRTDYLSLYEVVVVLRPRPSKTLDQILKICRKLSVHTIADVDDLVFAPKYAAQSPSVLNMQATEFSVRAQFKRNLEAMLCFDEIMVATTPLAQFWNEQTGRRLATVIPNGLSRRWLSTPVQRMVDQDDSHQTITYLPGTNSHNKDFSEIADVLSETLQRHKNVKLLIVGELHTDKNQFPADRLSHSRWVDYFKLPQIIASSSVTLAPLVQSPFTYSKSHIKFIESAAFGTPAICSPTADICQHTSDGLHVVTTIAQWRDALHRVLASKQNKASRQTLKNSVRSTSTADHSAEKFLKHWDDVGNDKFKHAAGQ